MDHQLLYACMLSRFSHVWFCATLWTAAHQAPLSMGFSRQEYWSGLPFPSPITICNHINASYKHYIGWKKWRNSYSMIPLVLSSRIGKLNPWWIILILKNGNSLKSHSLTKSHSLKVPLTKETFVSHNEFTQDNHEHFSAFSEENGEPWI